MENLRAPLANHQHSGVGGWPVCLYCLTCSDQIWHSKPSRRREGFQRINYHPQGSRRTNTYWQNCSFIHSFITWILL